MGHRCFEVSETDGIAEIVMNRPDELNTMIPEFWAELPQIVDAISAAGTARAVVLSSTGRHFTAGMDLGVFTSGPLSSDSEAELGRRQANVRLSVKLLQDSFTALERCRMPVIAAVQGGCIGGGVDLVTACDLRYATADAFFTIQEINIGMTADVGTLQRLPTLIPAGVAREHAYTGRPITAARAFELGLVNEVFDDVAALREGVLDVARTIASRSPLAVWGSKQMLTYARDHSVADGLDYVATWQSGMFQPADMMESFTARAAKREPEYDDLLPSPTGLE